MTKHNFIPYRANLVQFARKCRRNPTPAERKMWFELLANRQFLGLKFTRQKPLVRYIVDFYCAELLLAIEVDGDSHGQQGEYDLFRTGRLAEYGITVIRYLNREVMQNLDGVYCDLVERVEGLKGGRETAERF